MSIIVVILIYGLSVFFMPEVKPRV